MNEKSSQNQSCGYCNLGDITLLTCHTSNPPTLSIV